MATHKGLLHIVHLLLARNAEVNLQTHVSLSAKGTLHIPARHHNSIIVSYLHAMLKVYCRISVLFSLSV